MAVKKGVYDLLVSRGLVAQATDEDAIRELLDNEAVSFYIGFDATADSLHVGHFLQMVVMKHMQDHGHRPVALLGSGTTMIGDPSGKSDMRKIMTKEQIDYNANCFRKQMSKFLDFDSGKAVMADNGDWLLDINYLEFLRDYGIHFSVNRMLAMDSVQSRLERGLSFMEFNYMVLQSYDFLVLNERLNCKMQFGGNDQWSNIIGGVDLIRRVKGEKAYGVTFTLLTKKDGEKMGKTVGGAVWLDPNKTSPYEFFQYWRNVDDADLANCLRLLTSIDLEIVNSFEGCTDGAKLNEGKEMLAIELTRLVHSEEEAQKALETSRALFSGNANHEDMPTTTLTHEQLAETGTGVLDLLLSAALVPSKAEGRRLIEQGGLFIDNEKIETPQHIVPAEKLKEGIVVRKGKKVYHKIVLE